MAIVELKNMKIDPYSNPHKESLDRLNRIAKAYITHNSRDIRELAFASIEYCKVMEKYVSKPIPPEEIKGDPFF